MPSNVQVTPPLLFLDFSLLNKLTHGPEGSHTPGFAESSWRCCSLHFLLIGNELAARSDLRVFLARVLHIQHCVFCTPLHKGTVNITWCTIYQWAQTFSAWPILMKSPITFALRGLGATLVIFAWIRYLARGCKRWHSSSVILSRWLADLLWKRTLLYQHLGYYEILFMPQKQLNTWFFFCVRQFLENELGP